MYKSSTFFRAQGVLRRNVRLEFIDGSLLKHRMRMRSPSSLQPYCSTRLVRIFSRVIPCSGFFGCCSLIIRRSSAVCRNWTYLCCLLRFYRCSRGDRHSQLFSQCLAIIMTGTHTLDSANYCFPQIKRSQVRHLHLEHEFHCVKNQLRGLSTVGA